LNAGGAPANRIAQWDGASWSPLGVGLDNTVRALALDASGNLYVGGDFVRTSDSLLLLNRIGMWDGAAWNALIVGTNTGVGGGSVFVLAFDVDGSLYAGGGFTSAGGVSAARLARWDGSTWTPLGSGLNSAVRSIFFTDTGLFAGGDFATAGGVPANRIAEWNDSEWYPFGSGTSNTVYALARLDLSGLYAGGTFNMAGDKVSSRLGYWNIPNYAPSPQPDVYDTPEDSPLVVAAPGVLANDHDRNQDPMSLAGCSPSAGRPGFEPRRLVGVYANAGLRRGGHFFVPGLRWRPVGYRAGHHHDDADQRRAVGGGGCFHRH
jgi:hypothetical protein